MIWLFLISAIYPTFAQLSNDPNQLQNWCLDAKHHKSKPGPEDELHKQVSMKIRNERFFEVPLCASDCNAWFDACKDDFTCSEKWTDLIVKDGHLTPCHNQNECKTFADVFKTSKNFCEKVSTCVSTRTCSLMPG
ncbi:Folate receptor beta [Gryllus bimaculatus]|nr:Folate receptor beta [Gryllus bimaculatus]